MTYCRFIDDPAHIAELDGQRYIVLRPVADVATAYREVQRAVAEAVQGLSATHPAEPHVTLAGVGDRVPVRVVHDLVAEWARHASPLELEIERVSVFPAPFQVVIVEIRRTPQLFEALSSIRRAIRSAGLRDLASIAPEDWVFHMSVAYCSSLDEEAWARVVRAVDSVQTTPATEVVRDLEVVAFDDNREHSGGVVPLAGGGRSAESTAALQDQP